MKLVVFAKAPVMGRAKTRLAAGVGAVHALRLYRAMTARVLRNVRDARWETVVAVSPDRARVRLWEGFATVPQGPGSLSPRLARAMSGREPVCVIGTDCPQVGARDVADAFALLRTHDVVLGPADDGGFWLIGGRGVKGGVFDGVRWSSEHALADVAGNVARAGGRVGRLRVLVDVDDAGALAKVRGAGKRFV